MAIKFEKIKPGMELLDIHKERMGNTTATAWGLWKVKIIEVDAVARKCFVSWNGNTPKWMSERNVTGLYTKPTKAYLEQQERRMNGSWF